MDIKTKFNLGDIIYYASNRMFGEKENCPVCHGKKVVYITVEKGEDVPGSRCPECYGKGFIMKTINGYHPKEARIKKIRLSITSANCQEIKYNLENADLSITVVQEHMIFVTEAETQEKCDYLNRKEAEERARWEGQVSYFPMVNFATKGIYTGMTLQMK